IVSGRARDARAAGRRRRVSFQSGVRYSTTVAPTQQPRSRGAHAAADLTFIRSAMERSAAFTAVPGAGGVVTGLIGLSAAVVSTRQPTADRWLCTWVLDAGVGVWR